MSTPASNINILPSRYKVLERLGAGGMATVYKAEDTTLSRFVAVKVLHEHLVYEGSFRERFEREAKAVGSLNHPNIIQIYDYSAVDVDQRLVYYMVMQYLGGSTLAQLIAQYEQQERTLPQERIKQIMLDLCAALQYAHDKGIMHRDVKPANILFDEHQRAILTDFGIARLVQQSGLTQEGYIVGTPAYMSPEQATGLPVDGRADIYALGIIFYQLLTGKTPFEDDGTASILLKHINAPIPRVSEHLARVPNADIDKVIFTALAKNPQDRYSSASDFAADIEAVLNGKNARHTREMSAVVSNGLPSTAEFPAPASTLTVTQEFPNGKKSSQNTSATRIFQTITTTIVEPAKQNPLAFIALGIALVALLIVARMGQNPPPPPPVVQGSQADSMTGENLFFTSEFSTGDRLNEFWQQNDTDSVIRSFSPDGLYLIENQQSGMAVNSLYDPNIKFEDVSVTMYAGLTMNSSSDSGYGIVFRYQDAENYNVFAVDGRGRYSIWAREAGTWRELRSLEEKWTGNSAIKGRGEMNRVRLNVQGNLLTGFVNGEAMVQLEDTTFGKGGVGIYMATPQRGTATLQVDSYSTEMGVILPDNLMSQTDSMTGEGEGVDSMTGEGTESMIDPAGN